MSKAMLIIDMPSSCNECDLKEFYCHVDDNDICRAGGCPLREAPTFKEDNSIIHLERYEGYLEGWNDCVNEILGGGE